MGAAVVQLGAIGAPCGEHLELGRVVLDVNHAVVLYIVGNEVAGTIENLDLIRIGGVERLVGGVSGVDDEWQRGVPCGIDAGREKRVVLHVDFAQLAIVGHNGAAKVLAGVELHALGIVLLVAVAVDALA